MSGRFIVFLILLVVIFIYVFQNAGSVDVKFLFMTIQAPNAVITLGSFCFGIIIGFIIAKINQLGKERKKKSSKE